MDIISKKIILNGINKGLNLSLIGYSRSAIRTGFIIPEYNIFLDAGIYSDKKPELILVTHSHQDHINNLYSLLLDNIKNPYLGYPKEIHTLMKNYLDANFSLNLNKRKSFMKYKSLLFEDNSLNVKISSKNLEIKPFIMTHDVPCLGYGISEIKTCLHPTYSNLSQEEIKDLVKNNINVKTEKKSKMLLFCGDTNYKCLETLDYTYPYIIIESTFLYPEHFEESRKKYHLHFSDLQPYIEKYTETTFILIHFSKRYKDEDILEFFKLNNYPNIIPFV
ncbi:beta-lactamase superfamily domain protein [Chlorella virus XW01]|nr:beta-lactamase superfamily domain protein [Chlorella virus XW01]